MTAPRIVSLLPSATEIVSALGLGHALVGRSHECDFPLDLPELPVLTRPRIDINGTSRAIHCDVGALLEAGLSVYEVDASALKALDPDFIVTQTQCDVCAVTPDDLQTALASFTGRRPEIVSLAPATLSEVWASFDSAASALDIPARAAPLRQEIEARIEQVLARVDGLPRPSVACIEWIEPLMAAGNWIPELVGLAGGRNVFGAPGEHSPWLDPQALLDADPDVVAIFPCGFDRARGEAETTASQRRAPWLPPRALRLGRVAVADGHQFFNRPGPRLIESLEILSEMLHPELKHQHPSAWSRWPTSE